MSPVLDVLSGRPPRLRRGFIARDRLSWVVGKPVRTISLSAPVGFGKTQLMAYWRFEFAAQGKATLWADAESGQIADLENDIVRWTKDRTQSGRQLALFIDRSERMIDAAAFVGRLREALGDEALVVIAGRQDHDFSGSDVLAFDQEDLRFTPDETRAWLSDRLDGHLPAAADDAVAACAGVPALLNLEADELACRPEGCTYGAARAGRLTDIYFDQLIRANLRADLRPFLAELALLRDINPRILDGVAGRDAVLKFHECRLATPFFRRLGQDTYEMLPIASDYLLRPRADDISSSDFHGRAARWFAEQGDPARAIDHAVAAGDYVLAGKLLEHGLLPVVIGGEMKRAYRWLVDCAFSDPPSSPSFCLGAAMAFVFNQDEARARPFLVRLTEDERMVVEAVAVSQQDRLDRIAAFLAQVRRPELLPPILRTCFENLTRTVRAYAPSMVAPRWRGRISGQLSHDLTLRLTLSFSRFIEATQLLSDGQALSAADIFEPMLRELEGSDVTNAYLGSIIVATLATAYLQSGRIASAEKLLLPWLERIEQHSTSSIWGLGLLAAARIADAEGRRAECLDHLDRLEAQALDRNVLRHAVSALAERVRIHTRDGQSPLAGIALAKASEIYTAIVRDSSMRDPRLELEILVARSHMLRSIGERAELSKLLKRARALASRPRRIMDLAEIMLLSGPGQEAAAGWPGRALRRLGVDECDETALRNRLGIAPIAADACDVHKPVQEVWIIDQAAAIRLTPREQQIMSGLRRRLSNKAIARDIGLSAETVKWYVGKLLVKLRARDRQHAVERACGYGLVAHSYGATRSALPRSAGARMAL